MVQKEKAQRMKVELHVSQVRFLSGPQVSNHGPVAQMVEQSCFTNTLSSVYYEVQFYDNDGMIQMLQQQR